MLHLLRHRCTAHQSIVSIDGDSETKFFESSNWMRCVIFGCPGLQVRCRTEFKWNAPVANVGSQSTKFCLATRKIYVFNNSNPMAQTFSPTNLNCLPYGCRTISLT